MPVDFNGKIIRIGKLDDILMSPTKIDDLRAGIENGAAYVVDSGLSREYLASIRSYLTRIGQSSLPQYHPIIAGAPNSHRINRWDDRSYVKACFHQFSFFPWNDDIFDIFDACRAAYRLKNAIGRIEEERFLSSTPDEGCTARVSFQFYPSGSGAMNRHADPVDYHQLTVPLLYLSKKGVDFQKGGGFIEDGCGTRFYVDDFCDWGDLLFFNAQCVHGVEIIDPDAGEPWLDFRGRWIAILAINRLADTQSVRNSEDLDD